MEQRVILKNIYSIIFVENVYVFTVKGNER